MKKLNKSVGNRKTQSEIIKELKERIKELEGTSLRGTLEPKNLLRETTSIVNNTVTDEFQSCSNFDVSGSTRKRFINKNSQGSEIMIDEVQNSVSKLEEENSELENNLAHINLENEKLRSALDRAVKRSTIYQSKFFEMKDRIYRQTKRLTDEVNSIRRHFEEKVGNFFAKYTRILKEIVINHSKVRKKF